MARIMVYAWGPESKDYAGKSMTLYRDPRVAWGGIAIGGIRISHMSHIDGSMERALRATKGVSKLFTVQPLASAPKSQPTEEIDVLPLLALAEQAADQGNAALDAHLKSLSKAHVSALRPYATDLRSRAKDADDGANDAQESGEPA